SLNQIQNLSNVSSAFIEQMLHIRIFVNPFGRSISNCLFTKKKKLHLFLCFFLFSVANTMDGLVFLDRCRIFGCGEKCGPFRCGPFGCGEKCGLFGCGENVDPSGGLNQGKENQQRNMDPSGVVKMWTLQVVKMRTPSGGLNQGKENQQRNMDLQFEKKK
ncbi:MAG: hypothetical protein O7C56_03230, partial [Rickettsia endosymbiont of Ixodes persulcatus]|nr:hypothetical protein [Rickettsia endosymbiont of Ixodes persulcatus]